MYNLPKPHHRVSKRKEENIEHVFLFSQGRITDALLRFSDPKERGPEPAAVLLLLLLLRRLLVVWVKIESACTVVVVFFIVGVACPAVGFIRQQTS
jgi:hypothetical protein